MNPLRTFLLAALVLVIFSVKSVEGEKRPDWTFNDINSDITSISISADGEYMAVCSQHSNSGGSGLYLFKKGSNTPLWNYYDSEGRHFNSVAISADGEYIVAGSDSQVSLFDKNISTPLWNTTVWGHVNSVAISANGDYIAAGSQTSIYHFERENSSPIWVYETGGSNYVDISADGEYISAASGNEDHIYFFERDNSQPLWSYEFAEQDAESISISADGEYIIAGASERLTLFEKDSNMPLWNYTTEGVYSVSISADGEHIAAATYGNLYFFEKDSNTPLWTYNTDEPIFHSVSISADGKYIGAGSGSEGKVYFFDKHSSTPLWSQTTNPSSEYEVNSISVSADGEYIVAGVVGESAKVHFFNKKQPPDFAVFVDQKEKSANPGITIDYTVTIDNNGLESDTYNLQMLGSSEWQPTISQDSIEVAGESSGQVILSITVPEDAIAYAYSGNITVHAFSKQCSNWYSDDELSNCNYKEYITVWGLANQFYDLEVDLTSSTANISVQQGMEFQLKFNVTNSGNGKDDVTFSLVNAPSWVWTDPHSGIPQGQTHTFTVRGVGPLDQKGEYIFELVVTSSGGITTSTILYQIYLIPIGCIDSTAVNYLPEAEVDDGSCKYAPVAIAGQNATGTPGVPVQFSGAGTDEDGTIAKYEWDFDGDGIFEWSSTENGRELNIYNNEGTYTATLRVTDNDGFTATDTVTVIISEKTIQLDDDGNVLVEDAGEDDEGIPSVSLITSLISIGLLAIFRRK